MTSLDNLQSDLCHLYVNYSTIFTSPWIVHRKEGKWKNIESPSTVEVQSNLDLSPQQKRSESANSCRTLNVHWNWHPLYVFVTWILSPDGKHSPFSQRDLARHLIHRAPNTHKFKVRRAIWIYIWQAGMGGGVGWGGWIVQHKVSRNTTDVFIQCHMTSVIPITGGSFQRTTTLVSSLAPLCFLWISEQPLQNYLHRDKNYNSKRSRICIF